MLSGFNTNIRYRGVLFHVQSEDSGRALPHIITHVYHGGTILSSEKSSYAEQLDANDLEEVVKRLMEHQHKAVLKRLVGGEFDAVIGERLGDVLEATETRAETRPPAPAPPLYAEEPNAPPDAAAADPEARPFGESVVSDKPLDEVILNYLVENARKRRRQTSS